MIEDNLKTIHTTTFFGEVGNLLFPIIKLANNVGQKVDVKKQHLKNKLMLSAFLYETISDLVAINVIITIYPNLPHLIALWPIVAKHTIAYSALKISEAIHR